MAVIASVPLRINLVIVTAFPPELASWTRRLPLEESLPFPAGAHPNRPPLQLHRSRRILGITSGMGPFRAATSLLALGHDPRFDLRSSYWLVAGIAGVDPEEGGRRGLEP